VESDQVQIHGRQSRYVHSFVVEFEIGIEIEMGFEIDFEAEIEVAVDVEFQEVR
jgi:hypothetical protein